jgi:ComF family protein
MFSFVTDPLLTLLYPQRCRVCDRSVEKSSDGAACRDCWNSTKTFNKLDPLCAKCGGLLVGVSAEAYSTCKQCDEHLYDRTWSAGSYEKALMASVLQLKQTPSVPLAVRKCLIDTFERAEIPLDITIVPVPLSKQRLVERGFNQASLLAAAIAKHSGRPLDEHSLIRKRDTPMHRAAMDRKARETTVRNVFDVVRPNLIKGSKILLVDDLMTSGSTVSYCAKALKKSGAEKVDVLTLARAAF